jgi:hypothetical protein
VQVTATVRTLEAVSAFDLLIAHRQLDLDPLPVGEFAAKDTIEAMAAGPAAPDTPRRAKLAELPDLLSSARPGWRGSFDRRCPARHPQVQRLPVPRARASPCCASVSAMRRGVRVFLGEPVVGVN